MELPWVASKSLLNVPAATASFSALLYASNLSLALLNNDRADCTLRFAFFASAPSSPSSFPSSVESVASAAFSAVWASIIPVCSLSTSTFLKSANASSALCNNALSSSVAADSFAFVFALLTSSISFFRVAILSFLSVVFLSFSCWLLISARTSAFFAPPVVTTAGAAGGGPSALPPAGVVLS